MLETEIRGAHIMWLGKHERKRPILKLGGDRGDNIKMKYESRALRMGTGFIWLMIVLNSGILCK